MSPLSRPVAAAAQWRFGLFAAGAGVSVAILAWMNRLTFSIPWGDDARFYLPSRAIATRGVFATPLLNAPNGMYWTPDGFYLWLGLPMHVFGAGIGHARTICEVTVALGVVVWSLMIRRLTRADGLAALISLVLVAPPVILAANQIRMEAPVFLLFGLAMLFHVYQRPLAATAVLALSLLFHPITGISLVGYLAALAIAAIFDKSPKTERPIPPAVILLCVAVTAAFLLEAVHLGRHWALVGDHMRYQTARKLGRSLLPLFFKPQGLILGLEAAASAWMGLGFLRDEQRRDMALLLPLIAAGLGLQLDAVVGAEGPYFIYSLAAAPCLFLAIAARYWARSTEPVATTAS